MREVRSLRSGWVVLRAPRRVVGAPGDVPFLPPQLLVRAAELPDDVLLERVDADAGGEENLNPEPVGIARGDVEALVHAKDDVREVVQVADATQGFQPVRYQGRQVGLGEHLADVHLDRAGVG